LLDRERAAGDRWSAAEYTAALRASLGTGARVITEEELRQIHSARAEMLATWQALRPGDTLVLEYLP
jgi:hypothetical protein